MTEKVCCVGLLGFVISLMYVSVIFLLEIVTATAWLPTCDVISAIQWSYSVSALSGVHLPGKTTVWRR